MDTTSAKELEPRAPQSPRDALTFGIEAERHWLNVTIWAFVVLGVAVRLARYLLNYPLWCDETMLAANFLDRDYSGLMRPLDYRQVCPVLFLFIELTAVRVLGFSELALRFFPMLCAVASVPLFRHVASRIVGGVPLALAVAVFAVSGWPLRYAAEVKPYASDLFVSLVLFGLAVEWWKDQSRTRWLWALALVAPIAVAVSFPAVLVVGGIGVALFVAVVRSRTKSAWLAYAALGLGAVATFLALAPFYKTAPQDHDYFHTNWASAFPPLNNPFKLATWLASVNTGFMFAYPEGGERGLSGLTFACFAIACVVLWRARKRLLVAITLGPFGMGLIAAALHRYPYGVSARTMQYVAPMICLFTGLGAATLWNMACRPQVRLLTLRAALCGLAALGLGRLLYDVSRPYKTLTDARGREFARWFWTELARDAELVCAKTDLGLEGSAHHWNNDATDTYLCYQQIYSAKGHGGLANRLNRVSTRHPLRAVFFNETPHGKADYEAWIAEMRKRFPVQRVQTYSVHTLERKPGPTTDHLYVVYEFRPARAAKTTAASASGSRLR